MITVKDLSHYERAARMYCARASINPDDIVQTTGTAILTAENTRPRWMNVAEQMVHLSLMMVSMREAIGVENVVGMH